MLVSPMLPSSTVELVSSLLKNNKDGDSTIENLLGDYSIEEKVHILRFIYNRLPDDTVVVPIHRIWRSIIPRDHALNTYEHKKALNAMATWWDAFGCAEGMTPSDYDVLEQSLDTLGATPEGRNYFKWMALCPIIDPRKNDIWDEYRLGAIICLGRYAYNKETEVFLARHLDDWNTIQIEVVQILAAMKSRLLVKLAPWYMQNDDLLGPILSEYV